MTQIKNILRKLWEILKTLVVVLVVVVVMTLSMFKELIRKALERTKARKKVFISTRETVDAQMRADANALDEISPEEIEQMCEQAPFVMADVDESGHTSNYEKIDLQEWMDTDVAEKFEQESGVILVAES